MSEVAASSDATVRALILEDNAADAELILWKLTAAGLPVKSDQSRNEDDFKKRFATHVYDLILCDFSLPGWSGLEALRWVRQSGSDIPFIYVSGTLGEEIAVECIKEGATDYVLKGNLARLPHAVRRALDEHALRVNQKTSREEYRLLFESNPQPMWVFDRRTLAFLAVNEAAIRHYGYSRQEFLGMTILDIRPREEVPMLKSFLTLGMAPLSGEVTAWTHRTKEGTSIDVEICSHVVNFHGVDAELVLAQDITEMKRNQEKLRQSEERFSKAFRSSPVPITISTMTEGRYIDANDAFLRMIGSERDAIVGRTSLELNIWEIPQDRARMIDELGRLGRVVSLETIFVSKTGGRRNVVLAADLIQLDGAECVLAITNDVTDARSIEEQFRQAQKMEAVGRLAGGVAHDFNNMLSIMMGYCDLAEGRTKMEGVQKDVAQIKKAAQRAAALTRQLLAFSRQQVLRPSVLNLNDVVRGLHQMLLRVIAADIDLRIEASPSLGNVKADTGQIEQVLMNLVVNARDAMPRGGKIVVETANMVVDEAYRKQQAEIQPGRYVVLSVEDTGCGMDLTTLSRLFEPFFTTKPPGHGTGLGLSMVYGAMQQAEGHVMVRSEVGKGTKFELLFPRIDDALIPQSPKKIKSQFATGTETVLLVEDERDLRDLTTELLETEGYTVLGASDAETAIARSRVYSDPIHVLLTDLVLPGMGGSELATRVSEMRPDIKIVYMSGYAGDLQAGQRALEPGSVLVEKPFTKETLLRQLRSALDERVN